MKVCRKYFSSKKEATFDTLLFPPDLVEPLKLMAKQIKSKSRIANTNLAH